MARLEFMTMPIVENIASTDTEDDDIAKYISAAANFAAVLQLPVYSSFCASLKYFGGFAAYTNKILFFRLTATAWRAGR